MVNSQTDFCYLLPIYFDLNNKENKKYLQSSLGMRSTSTFKKILSFLIEQHRAHLVYMEHSMFLPNITDFSRVCQRNVVGCLQNHTWEMVSHLLVTELVYTQSSQLYDTTQNQMQFTFPNTGYSLSPAICQLQFQR